MIEPQIERQQKRDSEVVLPYVCVVHRNGLRGMQEVR